MTLGPRVCSWIERYVVHGEGDYYGQPFKLRPWQRAIIYAAYELTATGARRWRTVLLGLPKGNGKTEIAAAIAEAELAGPVVCTGFDERGRPIGVPRTSPDIPIAAASFDQADLLFGTARVMSRQGPLAGLCEVYDTEIQIRGRPGRLYRVAAAAGTNDGGRPTFNARDELHEWTGGKERVHLVMQNNLAKRSGTWGLDISTAGWDLNTLLGRSYTRGKKIAAGEQPAEEFLMIWFEADAGLDLADDAQFETACKQANPALGDFLSIENLRARYRELPEFEFRRYHLNQWVSTPSRWLPMGSWEGRTLPGPVPDGTPIVLALDGSYDNQSTGLIGCTLTAPHHLFVLERWEPDPALGPGWLPPKGDTIKEAIRRACARYEVRQIAANPQRWLELVTDLQADDLPIVEWPSYTTARIAPACKQLYDAVVLNQDVTQDGDTRFAQHFAEALVKEDKHQRVWITRAPLAVAAVMAFDLALRSPDGPSVYEERGVLSI